MTTWLETYALSPELHAGTIFEFNLPAATRWTQLDIPVVTPGGGGQHPAPAATWSPHAIKLMSVSCRPEDPGASATVEIGNADGSALTAFAGALKGSLVRIWDAWLNGASAVAQEETIICGGVLGNWEASGDVLNVTVDRLKPWADIPIPRGIYAVSCGGRITFKDALCAYAGADGSCEYTRAACIAHAGGSNWAKFGGFGRLDTR